METLLLWVARLAGTGGVALSILSALMRVTGKYWIAGLQVGTILMGGIAAMVLACLAYLAVLAERRAG